MSEEDLIEKYNKAFNEILSRILDKVKKGKYTEIDRALLNSVNSIISKLEKEVEDYSNKAIPKLYEENRRSTMEALATVLGTKPILNMVLVDERAIKEIQTIFSESMLAGLNETKKNINRFVKNKDQ